MCKSCFVSAQGSFQRNRSTRPWIGDVHEQLAEVGSSEETGKRLRRLLDTFDHVLAKAQLTALDERLDFVEEGVEVILELRPGETRTVRRPVRICPKKRPS